MALRRPVSCAARRRLRVWWWFLHRWSGRARRGFRTCRTSATLALQLHGSTPMIMKTYWRSISNTGEKRSWKLFRALERCCGRRQ
ncbi:hypothetical protein B0H19DRAFT_1152335 [Mycena capillaripes]|nr:hypothetical protein B0H19DRAFT_1152335 [Mycena capillaripes]